LRSRDILDNEARGGPKIGGAIRAKLPAFGA
jgi:hypothetical protein